MSARRLARFAVPVELARFPRILLVSAFAILIQTHVFSASGQQAAPRTTAFARNERVTSLPVAARAVLRSSTIAAVRAGYGPKALWGSCRCDREERPTLRAGARNGSPAITWTSERRVCPRFAGESEARRTAPFFSLCRLAWLEPEFDPATGRVLVATQRRLRLPAACGCGPPLLRTHAPLRDPGGDLPADLATCDAPIAQSAAGSIEGRVLH